MDGSMQHPIEVPTQGKAISSYLHRVIPKNNANLFHHLSFLFFLAACAMLAAFLKSSSEPGSKALNSYVNKKSFLALTHFGMHTGNGAH